MGTARQEEGGGLQQRGGCTHWAASELLGGTRTPSAPIQHIFWESLWEGAGAGSGGVERLTGIARVWRALC